MKTQKSGNPHPYFWSKKPYRSSYSGNKHFHTCSMPRHNTLSTPTLSRKASLDPHKRSDSFLSGNPESAHRQGCRTTPPKSASCMFCQASSEKAYQCGKHPTSGTLLACFLSYVCLQASRFGAPKRKPKAATPREFRICWRAKCGGFETLENPRTWVHSSNSRKISRRKELLLLLLLHAKIC